MQDRLFNVARRSTDFHHLRATDTGVRTLRADSAILDLGRMRDNAPHITEG